MSVLVFQESQYFRHPLLWGAFTLIAATVLGGVAWAILRRGVPLRVVPFSTLGAGALALLGLFAAGGLLFVSRVDIQVTDEGVRVRFFPLERRFVEILWENIAEIKTVQVSPLRDYGGWGLRWGQGGRAYLVSGTECVKLTLTDQSTLCLGSRRAAELEKALVSHGQ